MLLASVGCTAAPEDDEPGDTPGDTDLPVGPLTLFGRVSRNEGPGSTPPAPGAEVVVSGDFDGDGASTAAEQARATTDDDGRYTLTIDLASEASFVVSFTAEGWLGHHERLSVQAPTVVRLDATLDAGEPLQVEGTSASLSDGTLKITGLPAGLQGTAKVFDPSVDFDAFPGQFEDEAGNRLVSIAFCKVELRDAEDRPVEELGTTATLDFELTATTWDRLRDMVPGNGRIDVPQYDFDESSGQWVEDGLATLVDEAGTPLEEVAFPGLRDGEHRGRVFARLAVTHFSAKNIDVAQTAGTNNVEGQVKIKPRLKDRVDNYLACKAGLPSCTTPEPEEPKPSSTAPVPKKRTTDKLKWSPSRERAGDPPPDEALVPLAGALVQVDYFDDRGGYLGHILEEIEADGSFRLSLGRSEPDGEDLDGNGISGEKVSIRASVRYGGVLFHLLEGEVPTTDDYVADMGEVDVETSWFPPSLCELRGQALHRDGTPSPGTVVNLYSDLQSDSEAFTELCDAPGAACTDSAVAGPSGTFVLKGPFVDRLRIEGANLVDTEARYAYYSGARAFVAACPPAGFELSLSFGYANEPVALSVVGQQVSWLPAYPMQSLFVGDSDWQPLWSVRADTVALTPPITFGVVPAGAEQVYAPQGALSSGHNLQLKGSGTDVHGYPVDYNAELVVP